MNINFSYSFQYSIKKKHGQFKLFFVSYLFVDFRGNAHSDRCDPSGSEPQGHNSTIFNCFSNLSCRSEGYVIGASKKGRTVSAWRDMTLATNLCCWEVSDVHGMMKLYGTICRIHLPQRHATAACHLHAPRSCNTFLRHIVCPM